VRCGGNINLIACGQRSWRRFMNVWYLCPGRSLARPFSNFADVDRRL
jgi:hypothetical protein